ALGGRGWFVAMDGRRLGLHDASIDLAIVIAVLHHMDDELARDCLADLHRVLTPNGRVVVAEPLFTPEWRLSSFFLSMDRGKHIRAHDGYAALLDTFKVERAGFVKFSLHRFCSFVLSSPRSGENGSH